MDFDNFTRYYFRIIEIRICVSVQNSVLIAQKLLKVPIIFRILYYQ